MKIIQTFWSKPMLKSESTLIENRSNGGWLSLKYALLSMCYSCLTIQKYYPQIELYTDDFGINLFRDLLCLPYSNYHNTHSNMQIDENLWAFAKIKTYSMQTEPFLHIDNDIFVWDSIFDQVLTSPLVCQNKETITENIGYDYLRAVDLIHNKFSYYPDLFSEKSYAYAANMGVFGGNDIGFIREYCTQVFESEQLMRPDLLNNKTFIGQFNIVFEQLFLTELSRKRGVEIAYLFENATLSDILNKFSIESATFENKFVHCLGPLKKTDYICEQIEYRMRYEFPYHYGKVIEYLQSNNISFTNRKNIIEYSQYVDIQKNIGYLVTKEDVLNNLKLKLSNKTDILAKDGHYYVSTTDECYELKGWDKLILYFYTYRTGKEVADLFCSKNESFSRSEVDDNLFHIIMAGFYRFSWFQL